MRWLHKLGTSALFIDILLILVAIAAIIGLASFVRLHVYNSPTPPSLVKPLSYSAQALENATIVPDTNTGNDDQAVSTGSSTQVKGAQTNHPSNCAGTCSLPPNAAASPSQGECNENKKSQIVAKYDREVQGLLGADLNKQLSAIGCSL
jgi:hypothetical protein